MSVLATGTCIFRCFDSGQKEKSHIGSLLALSTYGGYGVRRRATKNEKNENKLL
jgi:hypothetical protein